MPAIDIDITSFVLPDTNWYGLSVSQACQDVEVTCDQDWDWCTNTVNVDALLAYRTVGAFIRETILSLHYPAWLGMDRRQLQTIVYIRSSAGARVWLKTVVSG